MNHTLRYSVGFGLSLLLTIATYLIVTQQLLGGMALIASIIGLAVVQLAVQLVCFLHISQESPRYRLLSFLAMGAILLIIVVGSLWIMSNLDYNMMHMSDEHMMHERDKGF